MKIKKQLTFFKSLRFRIMVLLVVIGYPALPDYRTVYCTQL
nr:hypothetical protein [Blautia argi]